MLLDVRYLLRQCPQPCVMQLHHMYYVARIAPWQRFEEFSERQTILVMLLEIQLLGSIHANVCKCTIRVLEKNTVVGEVAVCSIYQLW
jgi:hypothetical protein